MTRCVFATPASGTLRSCNASPRSVSPDSSRARIRPSNPTAPRRGEGLPCRIGERANGGPLDSMTQRHVLVINTDPSVLLVVHDLLQDAGYSVSLLSYH